MTKQISIDEIRIDGGTQLRVEIDYVTVDDYATAYTAGAKMPPLVVFYDGVTYWLADGFHRWHAAKKLGFLKVLCDVSQGSQRDAILYASGANDANGKRRTPADKRMCVTKLLQDPEWTKRSNNWIAETAKVSDDMVVSCRKQIAKPSTSGTGSCEDGQVERRVGRDGKTRRVKKKKPKKKKPVDLHVPPIDEPPAKPAKTAVEDKYADDRMICRLLAEWIETLRKLHPKICDKADLVHAMNQHWKDTATGIEEAEAA